MGKGVTEGKDARWVRKAWVCGVCIGKERDKCDDAEVWEGAVGDEGVGDGGVGDGGCG